MMKYKGVYQHDEKDCGIACLATICRFYGSKVSINQLRNMSKPNTNGYCIDELVMIAEKMGFAAEGLYGTKNEFLSAIKNQELLMPFIAHIKVSTGAFHYITIWKQNDKQVEVFDPSKGKIKIGWEEFLQCWTGYVISIVKTEKFRPTNFKTGYYRTYVSILLKSKYDFLRVFVLSILISAISVGTTYVYKGIIDDFVISEISSESIGKWYMIFSILCSIYFIRMFFFFLRGKVITCVGSKVETHMMESYFNSLLYSKICFYDTYKNGEIISRYYDINKVKNILTEAPIGLVLDFFMMVGILVVIAKINFILFLAVAMVLIIYAILLYVFNSTLFKTNRLKSEKEASAIALLKEMIDGIQIIKSHCAEQYFLHKTSNVINETIKYKYKSEFIYYRNLGILSFVDSSAELVILSVGLYLINKGNISIGELIMIHSIIRYLLSALENLVEMQNEVLSAGISLERLNDILDSEKEFVSETYRNIGEKSIHFTDVFFSYNEGSLILKKINFDIKDKEKIGIIGKSGCGKSTLFKVLNQFYEIDSGKIEIGKMNIAEIPVNCWRRDIGYVSQESFVFSASIRENIKLGNDTLNDEEILETLVDCQLIQNGDDIEEYLAKNAMTLSKGERQRLGLAREILKKSKLLILDEFTSNLDERTESQICNLIFHKECTCLIITHNLKIAAKCDRIFVMNDGRINEVTDRFSEAR